jgi:hypothetical protein
MRVDFNAMAALSDQELKDMAKLFSRIAELRSGPRQALETFARAFTAERERRTKSAAAPVVGVHLEVEAVAEVEVLNLAAFLALQGEELVKKKRFAAAASVFLLLAAIRTNYARDQVERHVTH